MTRKEKAEALHRTRQNRRNAFTAAKAARGRRDGTAHAKQRDLVAATVDQLRAEISVEAGPRT